MKLTINKIIILVIFVLMLFFGFLFRLTAEETLIDITKYTKIIFIYFSILLGIFYLVFISKKIHIESVIYICLILLFFLPYFIHFFVSSSGSDVLNAYASNELILFFYFILIFTIIMFVKFYNEDYIFLSINLVFLGLILAFLSIWFSVKVTPERLMDRFVGGFLRSGTEVTDPNLLSAILNITSMCAILWYILSKSILTKVISISCFIIIQAGRFFTFSNGGLFSILISLFFLLIFLKGEHKRKFLLFISIVSIFMLFLLLSSGLTEIIFYRLNFSDEQVANSSIYSRLEQYENFFRLILDEPTIFLYGVGSARLPDKLNLPVTLHNSYLRPLAVGGFLSFFCFLWLWILALKNYLFSMKCCYDSQTRTIAMIFFASYIGWSFQSLTLPYDVSSVNIFFISLSQALKITQINYKKIHERISQAI